jgi:hypothetical protein
MSVSDTAGCATLPAFLLTARTNRPIVTYGRQGVAKPGVVIQHHAIAHTSAHEPEPEENEQPKDGKTSMLQSIGIVPKDKRLTLHKMSRIDFSRMYMVEHNVKVFDFGQVHPSHLSRLQYQWITTIAEGGDRLAKELAGIFGFLLHDNVKEEETGTDCSPDGMNSPYEDGLGKGQSTHAGSEDGHARTDGLKNKQLEVTSKEPDPVLSKVARSDASTTIGDAGARSILLDPGSARTSGSLHRGLAPTSIHGIGQPVPHASSVAFASGTLVTGQISPNTTLPNEIENHPNRGSHSRNEGIGSPEKWSDLSRNERLADPGEWTANWDNLEASIVRTSSVSQFITERRDSILGSLTTFDF